ncbi:MAG TPA: DUF4147 domain-containing protein, partial [Terriglobales bacterium]|nr:DUF4147 domain-containing protein [Terriglobales bacterium]
MRSLSELRQDAITIFRAGLKAVDPAETLNRHVKHYGDAVELYGHRYPLLNLPHALVVGAGKASARMAQVIKDQLGDWISGGRVIVKYGHGVTVPDVEIIEAGHPVPDENGVRGTASILQMLERAGGKDLILCLISG